jgi:hypothetical protein
VQSAWNRNALADETKERPRKRLNASEKRERKAASWQLFVKRIGRKAQRGVEPNDRKHSVKMDRRLRRMQPEDFDRLARHGEDD